MVTALIGGQYGSEGKGNIARFIAFDYNVHVRVGGPNAGHTMVHHGRTWKMRAIPCGWANEDAVLVIGAGAVIDEDVLKAEVYEIEKAGYRITDRLVIDPRASIITKHHRETEGGVDGYAHRAIGSTGEGVGVCRIAKIARGALLSVAFEYLTAKDVLADDFFIRDTVDILDEAHQNNDPILLEGTQGSGLSLTFGEWPYVTSADTNAAQLVADCGIPPHRVTKVIMVLRTLPIRVAGNSGPLPGETTWDELDLQPEHTTVTGKVRRVGLFDWHQVTSAVDINDPHEIALTFCDYLGEAEYEDMIEQIEGMFGVPVTMVGHGPGEVRKRIGAAKS